MENARYAVVDIETTGSVNQQGKIIEIAIIITDGSTVLSEFSSLLNPERAIPYFITKLTGITNDMVQGAPKFAEVAKKIVELTQNCIFVAHNVSFDYGFIRKEFRDLGYTYVRPILCTVQLSRKTFTTLSSYKLSRICQELDIDHHNQHRALGDAHATHLLLQKIISQNNGNICFQPVYTIKSSQIPPLLDEEQLQNLPEEVGIYYFYDQQGDVIYVGKSTNIKKRIFSHFTDKNKSIDFKQKISSITYELTGSELIALLWESDEIKRLKPIYNRSQRRSRFNFGIFAFEDSRGYQNLYIDQIKNNIPLISFSSKQEAKNYLTEKVTQHQLCQKLSGLYHSSGPCFQHQVHRCLGACVQKEPPLSYNARLNKAIQSLVFESPNFYLVDSGRHSEERAVILIQGGKYIGFGYVDIEFQENPALWADCIQKYPETKDVLQIIHQFIRKGAVSVIPF